MSRICVKNLPKHVAEDRLRELFSQKGEITDLKLMRTKDGKSRQFAFVGFRTQREAEEAIKYFSKSYLDTSRITCEVAHKVGDPDIPCPWSRHSLKKVEKETKDEQNLDLRKGSSSNGTIEKPNKEDTTLDDTELQEFLQVMQPRTKTKLWADDTLIVSNADNNSGASRKHNTNKNESSGVLVNTEVNESIENGSSNSDENEKSDDYASDEVMSDSEYIKHRIRRDWSDSDSSDEDDLNDDGENSDDKSVDEKSERESAEILVVRGQNVMHKEDIISKDAAKDPSSHLINEQHELDRQPSSVVDDKETFEFCRLFIRNLPYTATEEDLEEHFRKFGNVTQVHIVVDKETKRSKGIAYVLYELSESAARALEELDNSIFQGRLLHVMQAIRRVSEKQENGASTNHAVKSFKQRREEQRKASEASGDTRAWNSLFMRPDTVVENVARKYGVSKGDLMDREADDLAVRIAFGESQIIAETKKALAKAGVNVGALEELANGKVDGSKRSNHVLLVKNLPYGSSENELAKLFGKFGNLENIILPPTKTMALVVFLESAEARAAFRGLAYKRYKDSPLYLEWAPGSILSQASKPETEIGKAIVGEHDVRRVLLQQSVEGVLNSDAEPDRVESRSLFVKNLNFKTSDETLRKHFSEHVKQGRIFSVKVKKHLKNGNDVSMGFGFIEFDTVETAATVCKDLQGTVLDGHALILQLCHAKKDEQVPKTAAKDKSSTKLLVRNVAFEATKKDLRQLFSPFGQIKSLRLPMKFGSHRGFAFVEYVTKQEAENAMKALSSTHLYGRHLVLERAKEGESLEELRVRISAQFSYESGGAQNLMNISKKRKQMAVLDEGLMKFRRIAD